MFKGKKITAVIMAAGKGSRMGASVHKQFLPLEDGRTVLEHAAEPFQLSPRVDEIIIVCGAGFEQQCLDLCRRFDKVKKAVPGGCQRQDSVNNALAHVGEGLVLIHDGARPFVSAEVIDGVIKAACSCGAAVPCVPVKETIRQKDCTLDRSSLFVVQTPQGFETALIKRAYQKAYEDGFYGTDDASLVDRLGEQVAISEGSYSNIKLTTREDLPVDTQMRVGQGFDVHKLTENRKLILCGVEIPFEKGLLGHSDADVALHALMDAMLGAACLGDIGKHFPDSDMRYKDIESLRLLAEVARLLAKQGWSLINADITIMAQRPKLLPHIEAMRQNIADTLGIAGDRISVKATTTEKLGFVGREEGIAAEAVCLLSKR